MQRSQERETQRTSDSPVFEVEISPLSFIDSFIHGMRNKMRQSCKDTSLKKTQLTNLFMSFLSRGLLINI